MKNKKICIVSSCGGHLTEVRMLLPVYSEYEYVYVLNDKAILADDMKDKTYFIAHSERDWKFFVNLWQALRIIIKEKPSVLMSTGAGPIIPFALVGKLFGIKSVYIETFTSIEKPSLTGRVMYHLADFFYYQWSSLSPYFPKGECIGTLL